MKKIFTFDETVVYHHRIEVETEDGSPDLSYEAF